MAKKYQMGPLQGILAFMSLIANIQAARERQALDYERLRKMRVDTNAKIQGMHLTSARTRLIQAQIKERTAKAALMDTMRQASDQTNILMDRPPALAPGQVQVMVCPQCGNLHAPGLAKVCADCHVPLIDQVVDFN